MKAKILRSFVALSAAVGFTFLVGCELDSSSSSNANDLVISPSSTPILDGQTIEFTAEGGHVITWSVDNPALGTFAATGANSINYTSSHFTPEEAGRTQILHAHSTNPDDSSDIMDAQATIIQSVAGAVNTNTASSSTNAIAQLTVSPSSATLSLITNTPTVLLTAHAGVAPYSWYVTPASGGTFNTTNDPQVVFTAAEVGPCTVSCKDQLGMIATAAITVNP